MSAASDKGPGVHTTAVTWAMQRGEDVWQVAGYFGMSPQVHWQVYGHHHPDFQRQLADRIGRSR